MSSNQQGSNIKAVVTLIAIGVICWLAAGVVAIAAGAGWTVLSPLLMTFLLMKVSGVALLEERLVETKPQYLDYMSQTPAFFPKFWR